MHEVQTLSFFGVRPTIARTRLDVGVPATLRTPVRVRDAVTEARALAADVAVGSHGDNSSMVAVRWIAGRAPAARAALGTERARSRPPGNRRSVTDRPGPDANRRAAPGPAVTARRVDPPGH